MRLKIPEGVDHTLSRFKGAGEREFELAVAQARSTGLMNCNSRAIRINNLAQEVIL